MSLVLPNPQAVSPADVAVLGSQVEAAARQSDDVHEVTEMAARWSAIAEYVRRTSTEGIAQAEATKRRLEMRIGELCPPMPPQESGALRSPGTGRPSQLPKNRLTEARQMAEAPKIVEQVISESTDADPPTKAKVIAAIKAAMRPSIEADIEARAAIALARWPELADPDGGLNTPADIADAGDLLDRDPHRIDSFRRHIAARRREREPGYVPPSLGDDIALHCAACGDTFTHKCPGGKP